MPGTKQDTICHPSSLPPVLFWSGLPPQAQHPFCLPTLQMHGYRYRVNVQGFCGIYFVLHFTFAAPRNRFAADSLLLLSFLLFFNYYLYLICISASPSSSRCASFL